MQKTNCIFLGANNLKVDKSIADKNNGKLRNILNHAALNQAIVIWRPPFSKKFSFMLLYSLFPGRLISIGGDIPWIGCPN